MSFSLGIVGLPNVGKSTLFNALTNLQVEAANYPFATVNPNVGVVPVPDERLQKLATLEQSKKIIPTVIEFNDIAGLVKNAHQGAGLGNQFLSHIREVDAIVEVLRFFEDPNVTHVDGSIDPKRDRETIETELILADLQMIEKKVANHHSGAKGGNREEIIRLEIAQKYLATLSEGKLASSVSLTKEQLEFRHEFPLLTNKPIFLVYNTKFDLEKKEYLLNLQVDASNTLVLDCQLESEISQLPEHDRDSYLKELGLEESSLQKLIRTTYQLLGLITFFTAGPEETRAWTCVKGTKAPQAAGVIHTDFETGFIKAEIINWQTLLDNDGWSKSRDKGLLRQEGKEYEIQDGDVVHFRFNV